MLQAHKQPHWPAARRVSLHDPAPPQPLANLHLRLQVSHVTLVHYNAWLLQDTPDYDLASNIATANRSVI